MPPVVFMVLGGIQAAVQAWPQIESIAIKGKEFISNLFHEGKITKEQQDALHARIDAISDAAQRGEIPEGWAVEPD